MTRTAEMTIQHALTGLLQNSLSNVSGDAAKAAFGDAYSAFQLTTGVDANQINRVIARKDYQLASGASVVVDLYDFAGFDVGAGAGKDALGLSQAWSKLVALEVWLKAGSAGQLIIGGEGSSGEFNSIFNGVSGRLCLRATTTLPGFISMMTPHANGWAIADGSNHLLKFLASGGACTFSLVFAGRETP